MHYKTLALLILSLKIEAHDPKKIVILLDDIHEAQAYWEMIARHKKLNFWKRPPQIWFSTTWKTDIRAHQKNLSDQRAELIQILGTLSDNPKLLSCHTLSKLQKRTRLTLTKHGAPSHFKRRWLSYAGVGAGAAVIAFYLHQFKQDHVLFIIPPHQHSIAFSLENFYPFLGPKYVVDQEGTQYLQVKKSEEEKATSFLAHENIIALKSTPLISLCWKNEQGENKIREFIRKRGIEPIKKIYTILKNEDQPETKLLTTNIKRNEEEYEKALTKVLINASEVEQTTKIIKRKLGERSIHSLLLHEKQDLFLHLTGELGDLINTEVKGIGEFLRKENEEIQNSKQTTPLFTPFEDDGRYPEFLRKRLAEGNSLKETANDLKKLIEDLGAEAKKYANVVNYITVHSPGFAGLSAQIFATIAFELKLKESAFTHLAQEVARDAQLNIELSKMVPFFIASYLGYAGMSTIYTYATALTIVTPLKTDLISLQLVLNKERYTKNCAALPKVFKGECFYWIQRLHRYKDSLPSSYRATYRRYLDDLENQTLMPEQKMAVITCLFHELDPLFKKE